MKKYIYYIFSLLLIMSTSINARVLQFSDFPNTVHQEIFHKSKSIQNVDSLKIFIQDLGFLDVVIIENLDTLHITLGMQYILHNIFLNEQPISIVPIDKKFRQQIISEEMSKIIQKENMNGYQFTTVNIDSTVIHTYAIDLFCSLNKGPQVKLDNIKFTGLSKTQHSFLYKYITAHDSLITPKLLHAIEEDARTIPFVQFVPPIIQEVKQGYLSADLILPFKENENLLFEGGGGYLSDQELFVWNMNFVFKNIFGAGREISIVSQKKDINHQNLKLLYRQPIFLLGIGSANMLVQTRDYRDQFYEFTISSGMQTYYKKKINLSFSTLYKSVELQNSNLSYRSVELSFGISNKKLLSKYNYTQKFIYDSKFSYGNRKYNSDTTAVVETQSSFNESRFDIRTQFYRQIKNRMAIFTNLHLQSYQTNENLPPFSELYLVGGTASIRGFKDEQFPSIRNLTITVEPQYQFDSGNLFIFYDGGYIYNRFASELSDFNETTIYRYGYGGGISLLSNGNSIRISLGWNKSLTFDNPRISLELKTRL